MATATIPTLVSTPAGATLRSRVSGLGSLVPAVALGVIWLHLLDATLAHPFSNGSLAEHVVLALLAIGAPFPTYLARRHLGRAWQGALMVTVGVVALSAGASIHLAGVIRTANWVRSDFTGVPMMVAGIALLVWGAAGLTIATPRARYRLLAIPAAILGLLLIVAPIGLAVFFTHVPRAVVEPRDLGAPYEEVSFETADGLTLRGWYVPSRNGAAVAVMHGSAGSRIGPIEHVRMLVRNGYGVLAFDTRGHGESDGATIAIGWGAHPDAAAAAAFLESRADVDPGKIGLLGISMGAEIAVEAAARRDDFAAVVADGPSGRNAADARDSSLPLSATLLELPAVFMADLVTAALAREPVPPALTALAPDIEEPILYIAAGTAPFERALVSRLAGSSPGSQLWVTDTGHTQGLAASPAEYERRVITFLDAKLLGVGDASPSNTR